MPLAGYEGPRPAARARRVMNARRRRGRAGQKHAPKPRRRLRRIANLNNRRLLQNYRTPAVAASTMVVSTGGRSSAEPGFCKSLNRSLLWPRGSGAPSLSSRSISLRRREGWRRALLALGFARAIP